MKFFIASILMYFGVLVGAGVKIDLKGFKLVLIQEDSWGWKKDKVTVLMERISKDSNQKLVNDRQMLLESLFETAASPYADRVSSKIVCENKFLPTKKELENGAYYSLWAGERFNFGVCADDLVKYRAGYGIFDCGKKGVFEVKIFDDYDSEDAIKILETFRCK